jgi:hypothetical protein
LLWSPIKLSDLERRLCRGWLPQRGEEFVGIFQSALWQSFNQVVQLFPEFHRASSRRVLVSLTAIKVLRFGFFYESL